MTGPAYNDPTWHHIANCDHAAFNQADSPQRPLEQCPSCGVFLRTVTTAEGWAETWAEQRRDEREWIA